MKSEALVEDRKEGKQRFFFFNANTKIPRIPNWVAA